MSSLVRFVDAQQSCFDRVCQELQRGKKESHWMWFIFPQLKGLGSSSTAQFYGLDGINEAKAFHQHPLLFGRLVKTTELVLQHYRYSIEEIFGYPDNLKFHSCMTLFALLPKTDACFMQAIETFFGSEMDANTLSLL